MLRTSTNKNILNVDWEINIYTGIRGAPGSLVGFIACMRPKINSNQTERWSQAIAARPLELEKEIWFKTRF